jgi:hypothetical protein
VNRTSLRKKRKKPEDKTVPSIEYIVKKEKKEMRKR